VRLLGPVFDFWVAGFTTGGGLMMAGFSSSWHGWAIAGIGVVQTVCLIVFVLKSRGVRP
jgi:hypothetical protein